MSAYTTPLTFLCRSSVFTLSNFAEAQILPFDDAAADIFNELRKEGVRIGTMDLRIASIALSRNMTVLSRNLVDFMRVPGLRVEDWTQL